MSYLWYLQALWKNYMWFLMKFKDTQKSYSKWHTPDNQSSCDQCTCEPIKSIPSLDTLCTIKAGNIETDLPRKPTDENTYLWINSCHLTEVVSNIPYCLAMRIYRNCREKDTKEQRLKGLKEMLLDRDYPKSSVTTKQKLVPRYVVLRLVCKKTIIKRLVFMVLWDPRLHSVQNLTCKHYRTPISRKYFQNPLW